MERLLKGTMFKGLVTDIFFDLDHTLWDFDRNSGLTFEKILSENGLEVVANDFLKIYTPINQEYWKLYREDRISQQDLRFMRLRKTFDTLGLEVSDDIIGLLSIQYIEQLTTFSHLLPSAREILDYLNPHYRLHIITNGFQEVQERKLKIAKIDHYFKEVINSEMAGVKKPNPYIFQLALQRAGITPDCALMVGDNMEADILGARAAGFHTLYFTGHTRTETDFGHTISELIEIKSYL